MPGYVDVQHVHTRWKTVFQQIFTYTVYNLFAHFKIVFIGAQVIELITFIQYLYGGCDGRYAVTGSFQCRAYCA